MKRLAYVVGAVFALLVLLVLLAPTLVDTSAARAEIQRRLSEALHGQVEWRSLEIALFPAPHGEVRGLRIEIPGELSAAAEEVDVYLRLWPLLRGSPEVSSLTVARPRVRIVPGEKSDQPLDYRTALERVARALQEFAPQMELRLDQASVEIGADFALRDLRALARTDDRGVALELTTAASLWKRLSLQARAEYADLSARAAFVLDGLDPVRTAKGTLIVPGNQPPQLAAELSDVDLPRALAIARTHGLALEVLEALEGKLSLAANASLAQPWRLQLEVLKSDAAVKLAPLPWKLEPRKAQVTVSPDRVIVTGVEGSLERSTFAALAVDVDLAGRRVASASGRATLALEQWLPWLQTKVPLEELKSVTGHADVTLKHLALPFDKPAAVDFDAIVTPRKMSAVLKALPFPVAVTAGTVRAGRARVQLHDVAASLGESTISGLVAQIDLGKTPRVSSASGRATVQLAQWFPWAQEKFGLAEISSLAGAGEVALKRLALRFDRPAEADYEASVTPRKVSARLKVLPGPVSVDGGAIRVDSKHVRLDNVAAAVLDLSTLVSGTIDVRKPAFELALAQGTAGEKLVRWALERGEVPARLEPKTPLRFAADRIAWAPGGALEADARVQFDRGPEAAFALTSRPQQLELRRLSIKDSRSNARLSATVAEKRIQAGFTGALHGASIAAMLRSVPSDSGIAKGDLRLTIDRARPQDTIAEGKLEIEALDLSWLAGRKVMVQRMALSAQPDGLRVAEGRFAVDDQPLELQGEGRRTPQGPVVDARITSPGVDVLRLLPPPDKNAPPKKKSGVWPLPLSGRVAVSTAFAQYKDYRIEPLAGILNLEAERVRLEVKEARMCGVSFPMEIEAAPQMNWAAVHITMKNQPLERTVRCLTGGNLELTGNADLTAELRTQGQRPHLLRDMTGTAQAEVRDGRVKKFALLGNILAFRGIASVENMKSDGFPYRRMSARGHFAGGEFRLEEGFFDSNAARLAASGRIDLLGPNSQLTVLIAPLTTVERVVGAVPLLGDVFGGTMVALPIAVHGDIRDPRILPLGPRAVTDQLLGIFERTLKLPGKLVVPAEPPKP